MVAASSTLHIVLQLFVFGLLGVLPKALVAAGQTPLVFLSTEEIVEEQLGPLLSPGAAITFPADSRWDDLNIRASTPRILPQYIAVVEVATEEDVEHTIRFANEHSFPFFAVSGTHSWASSINKIRHGIQINMRRMNKINVNSGGQTATAEGGILMWEATRDLFAQGKQTTTGLCECVSLIGPALGGGHGMLQGRHGFAADNLVSARVVLANGSSATASADENPELLWALRGAGQNFGVVTQFEMNVFDAVGEDRLWNTHVFAFTQDKLEQVFDLWNELEAEIEDPGLIVVGGAMAWNPELDTKHPVINVQVFAEGPPSATSIERYTSAFSSLSPAFTATVSNIPYGDLYQTGGYGHNGPVCVKDSNILGFPNSVYKWDPAGMRRGFALFSDFTSQERYRTSIWLLESYGRKGIQEIPMDSAAVPKEERERHILHSPIVWWKGTDEGDLKAVEEFRGRFQHAVKPKDVKEHFYLNYAVGDEELELVYGQDDARLERLKRLKKEWDPAGRFGFFNPL